MIQQRGFQKQRDKGQTLVEFALLLPLLLLLLVGIAEFTIAVLSYNTLADAARQGARYGIVHPSANADIENVARDATQWLDQDMLTFNITTGSTTITVEAVYELDLITGFLVEAVGGNRRLQLRAVSTMQTEY